MSTCFFIPRFFCPLWRVPSSLPYFQRCGGHTTKLRPSAVSHRTTKKAREMSFRASFCPPRLTSCFHARFIFVGVLIVSSHALSVIPRIPPPMHLLSWFSWRSTSPHSYLARTNRSHSRISASIPVDMDAQWQQFYWQHYLLQQQQQQQTSNQPTQQYSPTGTYGPMTHAVRAQQAHQHHPYTPSPSPSQQAHTPSPSASQPFPPPPPPPLPTAAPTTPTNKSFKHSPTIQHRQRHQPLFPSPNPLFRTPGVPQSAIRTPTHYTATSSTGPSSQHNGPAESALPACPLSKSSPGSLPIMVRLITQPGP